MMRQKFLKGLWLSLVFSLALTACGSPAPTSPVEPQITVIVNQVVTQVVATALPTAIPPTSPPGTPEPTATVKSLWDPFGIPIYYPLMGCVASRLHVGDTAIVATVSGIMGLYQSRDLPFAPLERQVVVGEIWYIANGPHCADNSLIWGVVNLEKQAGFIPEGNGETYWLLPAPPWLAIDQKTIRDLLKKP